LRNFAVSSGNSTGMALRPMPAKSGGHHIELEQCGRGAGIVAPGPMLVGKS
jgi:hypothetical protein